MVETCDIFDFKECWVRKCKQEIYKSKKNRVPIFQNSFSLNLLMKTEENN